MQDNFNFKSWISENRVGPYSKDNAKQSKKQINEALDLTPPSPENIYEPEESEQDFYDRGMGLVGLQVKDVIDTLRNDGFEDDEILDIFRTLLMDYDTAFSEIDEGDTLNEYEIACVERNGMYYKVNDEGDTVSGPYTDEDCTRRRR